jgi:hypothetical protein
MADVTVKFGADTAELVAAAEKAQTSIATVGQAAASAAAPLKTLGSAMDSDAAEAKSLAAGLAQVATAEKAAGAEAAGAAAEMAGSASSATMASKAHDGLAGTLGSNRMAMMEVGHSARAMADGLAAGMPPMRLLAMETPRLIQALTELGPGAMAALVSPAAAAVAGVAALAAGLGYLAYEGYASKQALQAAKEGMALVGNNNPESVKLYTDNVKHFREQLGYSKSDAEAAAGAIGRLDGPYRGLADRITKLSEEYAVLTKQDQGKAFDEVVKAANAGPSALEKLTGSVRNFSEEQKVTIAQAAAAGGPYAQFAAILDATEKNWGATAEATGAARHELEKYHSEQRLLARSPDALAPEDFGFKKPELNPKNAAPAETAQDADRARTEGDYNKVLEQRISILRDIGVLEQAVATAADPAAKAAAESALADARLKATKVHTEAETEDYQKQIAQIHSEAAAAAAGSQEKIEAAKREQEAIRQRNTVRDATGKTVVDGGDTAAYAEAGARVEAAEREHQAKLYQLQMLGIQQRQAAAKDDLSQQIALQQELVAIASKRGGQDPAALAEAERHLTELQRQEADKRVSNNLDGLRRQLTDDATTTAQREGTLQQYSAAASAQLNHNSDAYRAAMDFVRDETHRLEADKAQAALADLEVERRAIDQKQQAELKLVDRRQQLGQMTVQAAEAAELQIVSAHDAAVARIMTSEEKAARGIINLSQEVARRKTEIGNQEAAQATAITNKAEDDIARKAKSADAEIARSGASTITGLLLGRQSFAQAAEQMIGQLLEKELTTDIESMLSHSEAEAGKTGATETGIFARLAALVTGTETGKAVEATANATSVMGSAYKAAAGAYSALAGIPIIGPALGAAAAVATFAAVSAYNIFSAEGGMGQVPYDGAMFQLHKDEMVLPSWIASPLRAQLAAGGGSGAGAIGGATAYSLPKIDMPPAANSNSASNANNGGAGNSPAAPAGDTHLHVHMPPGLVQVTGKMSAHDLRDMESAVAGVLGKATRTAHRAGAFVGMRK